MYPQSMFCKNMNIVNKFQLKIVIFTAMKNRCMLHGRVFVMTGFAHSNFSVQVKIRLPSKVWYVGGFSCYFFGFCDFLHYCCYV